MIKKICITIILSIIIGIALFFGYHHYSDFFIGHTKVFVASHQISQRTLIREEDLIEIEVPEEIINEDMATDKNEIIGKYVKLTYTIPKGSFIYKGSIEENIDDYANTLLENDEVNYDIYTNNMKINTANLGKNMYIDLYLTINNKEKPVSDLLLSNARITGLYDSNSKLIQDYDKDNKVSIISIAINKKDVSILNRAQVIGELSCIVGKSAYDTNLKTSINTNSYLFDYFN